MPVFSLGLSDAVVNVVHHIVKICFLLGTSELTQHVGRVLPAEGPLLDLPQLHALELAYITITAGQLCVMTLVVLRGLVQQQSLVGLGPLMLILSHGQIDVRVVVALDGVCPFRAVFVSVAFL